MAMRKLKLQVQMTVDGFVAGPEGQLDWMTRNLDEGVIGRIVQITDSSDTILLGRKMTDGFIKYWEDPLEGAAGEGHRRVRWSDVCERLDRA
jgi:dihydrofolate reductase